MKTYLQEAIVRHVLTFRHITTATLLAGALTVPGQIWAQGSDDITVLLRSGERISGRLEDLNNGTLFVRVSTHDQRKLPVSQVALIDYVGGAQGLPETELGPARGADHVMVLRNSQIVPGHLVDIEGASAPTSLTTAGCTSSGQLEARNVVSQPSRSGGSTSVSFRPRRGPPEPRPAARSRCRNPHQACAFQPTGPGRRLASASTKGRRSTSTYRARCS